MNEAIAKLEAKYNEFLEEAKKVTNKSAQRRARKLGMELSKILKEFRQESLKV